MVSVASARTLSLTRRSADSVDRFELLRFVNGTRFVFEVREPSTAPSPPPAAYFSRQARVFSWMPTDCGATRFIACPTNLSSESIEIVSSSLSAVRASVCCLTRDCFSLSQLYVVDNSRTIPRVCSFGCGGGVPAAPAAGVAFRALYDDRSLTTLGTQTFSADPTMTRTPSSCRDSADEGTRNLVANIDAACDDPAAPYVLSCSSNSSRMVIEFENIVVVSLPLILFSQLHFVRKFRSEWLHLRAESEQSGAARCSWLLVIKVHGYD